MKRCTIELVMVCAGCGAEAPAWESETGKPEIPPEWRALRLDCEADEFYVCSPMCLYVAANAAFKRRPEAEEVTVRGVVADLVGPR